MEKTRPNRRADRLGGVSMGWNYEADKKDKKKGRYLLLLFDQVLINGIDDDGISDYWSTLTSQILFFIPGKTTYIYAWLHNSCFIAPEDCFL